MDAGVEFESCLTCGAQKIRHVSCLQCSIGGDLAGEPLTLRGRIPGLAVAVVVALGTVWLVARMG